MAIKKLFRTVKKAAGAPGSYIGGKFADAKVRTSKRRSDQIVDDARALRSMKKNNVEMGSATDPNSRKRRQMRVDDFQDEMSRPKRRLFGSR